MKLLTTTEAAEYLRLKERKLYELVADGAIPCTKITGRWLFPEHELDRWLRGGLVRPDGMVSSEPMPIVGGTHDPLLDWALRESASGLATLPEGSETGFKRFIDGEIMAAAIHLHVENDDAHDANVEAVRSGRNLHDAVLLAFVRREQGLVITAGNPLGLGSLRDVAASRARIALRPKGAGAQLLLQSLLHRDNIGLAELKCVEPPCPTGPDIAQAIRAGRADCGIATRSVANAAGLGFVSLCWERLDVVTRQRDYFGPALQAFFGFLRTPALVLRAAELGGYDAAAAGQVRFVH